MSGKYVAEERLRVGLTLVQLFRQIWPYLAGQKALFWRVVLAMGGIVLTARALPFLLGLAIDRGLLAGNYPLILRLAMLYLVCEILYTYLLYYHADAFARLGNLALFKIREDLISHVQHLPVTYFDRNPAGRIVTRLTNDVNGLNELFARGLLSLVMSFLELVAIVIAMLLISPKLTVFSLLSAPFIGWLAIRLSQRIRHILRKSKKKQAAINAFVAESINGMAVIQLFSATSRRRQQFHRLSRDYVAAQNESVHAYALLWPITSMFSALSVGFAVLYGGYLNQQGALALGALVAFITHLSDFSWPVRNLLERYQQLQNSLTSAERVFQILEEPVESGLQLSHVVPNRAEPSPQRRLHIDSLRFANVYFRYQPDQPWVLKDLNLEFPGGQSVALVGHTGSGKSTMIALISRFYNPTEGQIFLGKRDIREIELNQYRSLLGIVQQDNFLFRGTIADNIGLRDPSIDRAKIAWAAHTAYCGPFLERLSDGLDSPVQERGANLSAGQRQLIAFARVLAFDPQLLILDEATANIDSQSEALIQKATHKVIEGRTSIIIAHRLSTILDCNQIVVLSHGEIQEKGTHNELLRANGLYASLHRAQFSEPTFVDQ